VEEINLHVKLLPLLKRQVEVDTVLFKHPKVHIIVNKDGKSSLDVLSQNSDNQSSTENKENLQNNSQNNSKAIAAIAISGVNISNGEFIYENLQSEEKHSLNNFNLQTGNLLSSKPESIKINGELTPYQMSPIEFTLDAQGKIDINTQKVDLENILLSLTGNFLPENNNEQTLSLDIPTVALDQKQQQISLSSLNLKIEDKNFSPELSTSSINIDLARYLIPAFEFTLTESSLNIEGKGKLSIKDWDKNLTSSGKFKTNTFALAPVLKKLNIDYQPSNTQALQAFALDTQFTASDKGASAKHLKVNLDDSELQGDIAVINFTKPQFRFDLDLNSINLDNYLPSSTISAEENADSAAEKPELALAVPIALFKDVNANGIFRAKSLIANGATINDIDVTIESSNKQVVITPNANLYNGSMAGVITYKELNDRSTLNIENNFNLVNFGPLLKDTQITDLLSGLGSIKTNLTITDKDGIQTNNGTIALAISNGALKGVDIKKILDSAQNRIRQLKGKEPISVSAADDETRFAEMLATLTINNNVITNKDLSIKAPAFRIGGQGTIDLNKQNLNYNTNIDIVETSTGQGGKSRDELKGLTIPVKFTGALTDPKPKIDFSALVKANTKKDVDRKKSELKAKAAKKLGINNEDATNTDASEEDQLKDKLKKKLLEKLF
jgi:AsmA protein